MAYPTFLPTLQPDAEIPRQRKPNMYVNQFGDGYEQVVVNGRNNQMEELPCKWTNATASEAAYIIGFLEERKGRPFLYKLYNQGPLKTYRCTDYAPAQKRGNYYNITATLKQTASL